MRRFAAAPVLVLGTDENERVTEVLVYILYFKRSKRAFSLKEIHRLRRLARELAYASVLVGVGI